MMCYELAAKENKAKYFGPAAFVSFVAFCYCNQQWLSSAEYLAFSDMQNKLKELGIEITVKENIEWYGTVIVTTKSTNYNTTKNMSYSEFRNWINQYELAKSQSNNLWKCAELLMLYATWLSLFCCVLCLC